MISFPDTSQSIEGVGNWGRNILAHHAILLGLLALLVVDEVQLHGVQGRGLPGNLLGVDLNPGQLGAFPQIAVCSGVLGG